jgi:RNA-binding protein
MSVPRRGGGRSGGGTRPLPHARGAEAADAPGERTPKKKAGGARRTRMKARLNKKSGDVRSKPETLKKKHTSGPVTGGGIRYLRGLGHHLDPVVQIGKDGITDALVAATNEALRAHELIKVKVGTESPIDRKEAGPELADKTGATLAQVLGRTLLLYKRHPSKPKIELPR